MPEIQACKTLIATINLNCLYMYNYDQMYVYDKWQVRIHRISQCHLNPSSYNTLRLLLSICKVKPGCIFTLQCNTEMAINAYGISIIKF